jgi:hypothetical protein
MIIDNDTNVCVLFSNFSGLTEPYKMRNDHKFFACHTTIDPYSNFECEFDSYRVTKRQHVKLTDYQSFKLGRISKVCFMVNITDINDNQIAIIIAITERF